MSIIRTLNQHVSTSIRRYPSLYHGKHARIMCLDHILFGYGTGYRFTDDGNLINVYDSTYSDWIKYTRARWLEQKKQWLADYEERKQRPYYSTNPHIKESIDSDFNDDKWYYEKFDPYADRHKNLRDGTLDHILKPTSEVYKITYDYKGKFSLINNIPSNVHPGVIDGINEILNYMIENNQDVSWAKRMKQTINK